MKAIRNILIIKGSAQYNAARDFCDGLQQALCGMGYLVTMLDLTVFPATDHKDLFDGYDMIISFDVIGIELYNSMTVRPFFWTLLIDPPYYLDERLKKINDSVMVSCIDRRHVLYIDKYYKNIPWTCFMPHGGIAGEVPVYVPYKDRKYNVVVFGSLQELDSVNTVVASLKEDFDPLMSYIVEDALSDLTAALNMIVSENLNRLGIEFNDDMLREFMYRIRGVDALRRYHKRSSLIKNLIKNGLYVDIWGAGWEQILSDLPDSTHLKLHGSVCYEETKYIMSNSRILVNDMPPYYEGSHERIFAAMQCGTVVATDRSTYLEECFTDDKDILFYDMKDIGTLASRIKALIEDHIKAESIIASSLQSASYHTWASRAASILEITDMIYAN